MIRLIIAVQRPSFRAAVKAAVDEWADFDLVGDVSSPAAALERTIEAEPDVAIVDADIPPMGGMHLCMQLKDALAPLRVLIVTDRQDEALLLAAVEAGADGYLACDAEPAQLAEAIETVHAGQAYVPPPMLAGLLAGLIKGRRNEDSALSRFVRLSRREKEVLALMAGGLTTPAIAKKLFVSPHTARTHVQNVLGKLEVHSRVEATTLAVDYHLIERFVS